LARGFCRQESSDRVALACTRLASPDVNTSAIARNEILGARGSARDDGKCGGKRSFVNSRSVHFVYPLIRVASLRPTQFAMLFRIAAMRCCFAAVSFKASVPRVTPELPAGATVPYRATDIIRHLSRERQLPGRSTLGADECIARSQTLFREFPLKRAAAAARTRPGGEIRR
jgi:hypothetical protein